MGLAASRGRITQVWAGTLALLPVCGLLVSWSHCGSGRLTRSAGLVTPTLQGLLQGADVITAVGGAPSSTKVLGPRSSGSSVSSFSEHSSFPEVLPGLGGDFSGTSTSSCLCPQHSGCLNLAQPQVSQPSAQVFLAEARAPAGPGSAMGWGQPSQTCPLWRTHLLGRTECGPHTLITRLPSRVPAVPKANAPFSFLLLKTGLWRESPSCHTRPLSSHWQPWASGCPSMPGGGLELGQISECGLGLLATTG